MKPINLLGAATVLLMAATPAYAVNWVYVSTMDSGTDTYFDADSIRRSGNQVTVWERLDHSRDKTEKERERKKLVRYDCAERTRILINVIAYYPDGTVKSATWQPYEQEAVPVAPGTVGEATLEAVCAATTR